jgi:hypothetical protein
MAATELIHFLFSPQLASRSFSGFNFFGLRTSALANSDYVCRAWSEFRY